MRRKKVTNGMIRKLIAYRQTNRLTQEQAAKKLGVSPALVGAIETGQVKTSKFATRIKELVGTTRRKRGGNGAVAVNMTPLPEFGRIRNATTPEDLLMDERREAEDSTGQRQLSFLGRRELLILDANTFKVLARFHA